MSCICTTVQPEHRAAFPLCSFRSTRSKICFFSRKQSWSLLGPSSSPLNNADRTETPSALTEPVGRMERSQFTKRGTPRSSGKEKGSWGLQNVKSDLFFVPGTT